MTQDNKSTSQAPFTALPTAVQWSHVILTPRLRPGDVVVDATAGNGHDTVFLAQRVLPSGKVFAFDVQAEAISQSRAQLTKSLGAFAEGEDVTLFHGGHERLGELLPPDLRGALRAVMFNLGYLPGGDKSLITRLDTTLFALDQALQWLARDGVLTVVVYPGHAGGREEAEKVEQWVVALPSDHFEAQRIGYVNFRPTTPFCLVVRKRV